jgi:hypothetical protein
MAKHYSAEQWAAWVGEQRDSELSVAEFCEWIGVSLNSFYRWRQKLAAEDRLPTRDERARDGLARERQVASDETQRLSARKGLMSSEPRFVPLTVLTSPAVEIDMPCGAVVRVPNDDRSLRRVLGILLEADQRTEVSAVATPAVDRHAGGHR